MYFSSLPHPQSVVKILNFSQSINEKYFTALLIYISFIISCASHMFVLFSSQSCPTLCNPTDCSTPGFPVHQPLPKLLKLMSIESVMPSNHLILCHPLLLLPSIFLSLRVFSNDSVLLIRWPKYWSFSFSISPSDEYMTYNTICYAYNLTSQIEKLRSRNSQIA